MEPAAPDPQELLPTGQKILRHWRKYRPRMCKELEEQGKLLPTVIAIQEQLLEQRHLMHQQGMSYQQVDEILLPMWALPSEETDP